MDHQLDHPSQQPYVALIFVKHWSVDFNTFFRVDLGFQNLNVKKTVEQMPDGFEEWQIYRRSTITCKILVFRALKVEHLLQSPPKALLLGVIQLIERLRDDNRSIADRKVFI